MAKQPSKSRRGSMSSEDELVGGKFKTRTKKDSKGRSARVSKAKDIVDEEVGKIARRTLVCKTPNHKNYRQKIESTTITIALGPAGAGKTYIPTMMAAKLLEDKKVERIVITRPAVSDEDYGALPGDINDKTLPWFAPVKDVLCDYFGASHVDNLMGNKKIEFIPFGYLRGKSLHNAFIILDEAQNTTPRQMKTFLTRIGQYSRVVVTGDLNQTDISGRNGLHDAIAILHKKPGIAVQLLTKADVLRSDIVRVILDAYEPDDGQDLNRALLDSLK